MMRSRVIFSSGLFIVFMSILQGCRMNYPVPQPGKVTVSPRPQLEVEGKRLTMLMCASCHYDSKTKSLSGKRMNDTPRIVGKVYSANLTHEPSTSMSHYTDSEIKILLRTGISRDGKLMPYMMRPNLADNEIDAIVTFLHSDDPLVAAKPDVVGNTRYTPIGKFGISRTKPIPYSDKQIMRPTSDTLALGKYLVDNLGCYHCHSKSFLTLDYKSPEHSKGFMGGGNRVTGADGKTIKTPNLTFHETGLAGWTASDLQTLLKQGFTPGNDIVRYPMPLYPELTDHEIVAMYKYLKQLPPIKNDVK